MTKKRVRMHFLPLACFIVAVIAVAVGLLAGRQPPPFEGFMHPFLIGAAGLLLCGVIGHFAFRGGVDR
ncbi:hypothetical protein ACXIVK_28005 [Paraburkholderia caledonica]